MIFQPGLVRDGTVLSCPVSFHNNVAKHINSGHGQGNAKQLRSMVIWPT